MGLRVACACTIHMINSRATLSTGRRSTFRALQSSASPDANLQLHPQQCCQRGANGCRSRVSLEAPIAHDGSLGRNRRLHPAAGLKVAPQLEMWLSLVLVHRRGIRVRFVEEEARLGRTQHVKPQAARLRPRSLAVCLHDLDKLIYVGGLDFHIHNDCNGTLACDRRPTSQTMDG